MSARRYSAQRPIRLSDTDEHGRLRLDAVARYLQDVAADDVLDAGWTPVLDVVQPFLEDTLVELTTRCAGTAASAALRCTSVTGDRGGRIDAEMTWIHLGPDLQPQRLGERFLAVYGESAAGRRASTRLVLPGPPDGADQVAATLRSPYRATLEYRQPLDLGDLVELRLHDARLWFTVGGSVRAAAILSA